MEWHVKRNIFAEIFWWDVSIVFLPVLTYDMLVWTARPQLKLTLLVQSLLMTTPSIWSVLRAQLLQCAVCSIDCSVLCAQFIVVCCVLNWFQSVVESITCNVLCAQLRTTHVLLYTHSTWKGLFHHKVASLCSSKTALWQNKVFSEKRQSFSHRLLPCIRPTNSGSEHSFEFLSFSSRRVFAKRRHSLLRFRKSCLDKHSRQYSDALVRFGNDVTQLDLFTLHQILGQKSRQSSQWSTVLKTNSAVLNVYHA